MIIPNFEEYSLEYEKGNPIRNIPKPKGTPFVEDEYNDWWDKKISAKRDFLNNKADASYNRSILKGAGVGVLSGGALGALAGNVIGGSSFDKLNPKDKFIIKYLYENPKADKIEAERVWKKYRNNAKVKAALIGGGIGATVGGIGGGLITDHSFNKALRGIKAKSDNDLLKNKGLFYDEQFKEIRPTVMGPLLPSSDYVDPKTKKSTISIA